MLFVFLATCVRVSIHIIICYTHHSCIEPLAMLTFASKRPLKVSWFPSVLFLLPNPHLKRTMEEARGLLGAWQPDICAVFYSSCPIPPHPTSPGNTSKWASALVWPPGNQVCRTADPVVPLAHSLPRARTADCRNPPPPDPPGAPESCMTAHCPLKVF